jgi:MFS family permease
MPRMLATRRLDLDAPTNSVRAAIIDEFGAAAAPDGVLIADAVGVADDGALYFAVEPLDAHACRVELAIATRFKIPFFQWAIGPMVLGQMERAVEHATQRLAARLADADAPAPLKAPLLLPRVSFTARQANQLAVASFATSIATFGGALFGQNAQSIQDSFGVSDSAISNSLAASRIGALVTLFIATLADRVGRRRLILVGLSGVAIANLLTALSPNLWALATLQVFARGFLSAAAVVAGIMAIEEAPEGARAFAASMLALAGGLGFTVAVVLLPIADFHDESWRLGYVVSGLTILLVPRVGRHLAEGRRFTEIAMTDVERGRPGEVLDRRYGRRFAVLAVVGFLTNVLNAPSAQLTNKYLEDDRGFSNSGILGFRAATTGFTGFIGVILAGRLSEARGRRPVAATFLLLAALGQIVFFLSSGPPMWLASGFSVMAASCGGLALGTMNAELFPTEVRGTSNGMLLLVSVMGSATGLFLAGALSDPLDGIGKAIALCAIPTLLAAILFVPRLPESAGHDLDEISPPEVEDAR